MICLNKFSTLSNCTVINMEHSGYKARIMRTSKLSGDCVHGLPPGIPCEVIPIHCLPGCPDSWVKESGSYIVPIERDESFWFDWTENDPYMTAIVPSVKGINPLTGQKLESCQMEQYRDACPIHGEPFAHDRYCEKCNYKWLPQNYISYPNKLWLDGWLQPDGTVRQFFFTEDMAKDVASCVIGKENTVPAFGFAFFRYTKEVVRERNITRGFVDTGYYKSAPAVYNYSVGDYTVNMSEGSSFVNITGDTRISCQASNSAEKSLTAKLHHVPDSDDSELKLQKRSRLSSRKGAVTEDIRSLASVDEVSEPALYSCDHINIISEEEGRKLRPSMYESVKEVSVGAGAAISQKLDLDMRALKDYHAEPQAVMRVYFVFEPQLRDIVARGGIKKIEGVKEGFLKGVPVGA